MLNERGKGFQRKGEKAQCPEDHAKVLGKDLHLRVTPVELSSDASMSNCTMEMGKCVISFRDN